MLPNNLEEMNNPLVTIIVLTYNSGKYVTETLESVRTQTYQNIELIICDDCSRDDTVNICKIWISQNSGRFNRAEIITSGHNTGIPANLNRGIKAARGEWIKGIAGDDLFLPNAIEIFNNEIKKDSSREKLAYHARTIEFYDNMEIRNSYDRYGDPSLQNFNQERTTAEEQFDILLRFCPIAAPTIFIHKIAFEKAGYFDERFKFWEDRPMWLKMTSNGIKFHFINTPVVKYRKHADSVQNNSGNTLFSRTFLSMNDAIQILIVKHLTYHERVLYKYLFFIRKLFIRFFNNRKTIVINFLYKFFTLVPEEILDRMKHRYSP